MKKMKRIITIRKILSILLAVFLLLTAGCASDTDVNIKRETHNYSLSSAGEEDGNHDSAESKFLDVQDSMIWYYRPVYWAEEREITKGTSENLFSPDQTCTRGEIVTFLWRCLGKTNVDVTLSFKDVSPEDYFYDAVKWAVNYQITNGVSLESFSPDAFCSRAQIVTFIWRCAQSPSAENAKFTFTDVPENEFYTQAVRWAVENHITYGVSETSFSPESFCTRAEVVTFLYRAVRFFSASE